jgi:hypothetical protein
MSLNTRQGWKGLPGTNTFLITETVNYGRNKFYGTGPWRALVGAVGVVVDAHLVVVESDV